MNIQVYSAEETAGDDRSNAESADVDISSAESADVDISSAETDGSDLSGEDPDAVIMEDSGSTDSAITTWAALQEAINHADSGSKITLTQTLQAGSSDVGFIIPEGKNITLDLNGYALDRHLVYPDYNSEGVLVPLPWDYSKTAEQMVCDTGYVIYVPETSSLTVQDSSWGKEGLITGGAAPCGGGIYNEGTVVIDGGTVMRNYALEKGGGIYNLGTLTFSSGLIRSNRSEDNGGGIWNEGIISISGAYTDDWGESTILSNWAKNNGGAIYSYKGTINTTGGLIRFNRAENGDGGGIYMGEAAVLEMSDGKIIGNIANSGKGGGVLVDESAGSVKVSGSIHVQSNSASTGGGIYLLGGKVLEVTGEFAEDASVRVDNEVGEGVCTSGYSTYNAGLDPQKIFYGDSGYAVTLGSISGEVELMRLWVALQNMLDQAEDGAVFVLDSQYVADNELGDKALVIKGNKTITIDLNQNVINRNLYEVSADGSVFIVEKGSTLIIKDSSARHNGSITGGYAEHGGGIYNEGTLIFESGRIEGNKAVSGGGVYNKGTFKTSGIIDSNTATYGGGIYNESTGIFDGYITSNTAAQGGGVYNTGTAEVKDGSLNHNTAQDGNGGAILNEGMLSMSGGTIEGNDAKEGGGIYNNGNDPMNGGVKADKVELTITGGELSANGADLSAGGIYVNNCKASLSGCVIEKNRAKGYHGGGIYVTGSSTVLDLSGCSIINNYAEMEGGGILVNKATGSVNVSGALVVSGNTVYDENDPDASYYPEQNIFLRSGKKLNVSGALTRDALIGITMPASTTYGGTFTTGYKIAMGESDPSSFFVSDKKGYFVMFDGAGEVQISEKSEPEDDYIEVTSWAELRTAVSSKSMDTVKIRVMNDLGVASGNAHNEGNTIEIDLNGHEINGHGQQVFWNEQGTMTIKNGGIRNAASSEGSAIKNSGTVVLKDIGIEECNSTYGGGIINHGTLTMTGGTINSCTASMGGALYVVSSNSSDTATATLTGVDIWGNTADGKSANGRGGAIRVAGGTLTMTECKVRKNKSTDDGGAIDFDAANKKMILNDSWIEDNAVSGAERQGGAINLERGTATISGCVISSNSAPDGGAIYINDEFVLTEISFTEIYYNKSTTYGGGGITAKSKVIITNNTRIVENKCHSNGAGIWASADLEISDSEINGNECQSGSGGGIYISGSSVKLTMNGGSITNCEASRGGALRLLDGATAILTDVEISENSADGSSDYGRGGAIGVSNSTLTMERCTLTGNKSTDDDGGAIDFDASGKKLTLKDTKFSDNSVTKADRQGGALNLERGTATISGCTLTGNSASEGGAIYVKDAFGSVVITGSAINNNKSTSYGGGGIWSAGPSLEISDTKITGNACNGYDVNGGGICITGGTTSLKNVTVTDNQAKNSGGIYFNGASLKMQGELIIKNNKDTNLYLIRGKKITVTGKIEDRSSISVATDCEQLVITDGFSKNGNTNANVFLNDGGRQVYIDENGEVCFGTGESTGNKVFDRVTVTIRPKSQHYTLNIRRNGEGPGQNAVQLYNIGDSQRFWLTAADENSYYIDFFNGADEYSPSNKRLDIEDDDKYMKVGSIVHVVKGNKTAENKRWRFIKNDDGSYYVQNMKSGLFWALNDDGYEDGRKLCQKEYKDAEKWEIEFVAADGEVPIEELKEKYDSFTKTANGQKITSCNWMGFLSDDVVLSDITIPGTHDSSTAHCTNNTGLDPVNASAQCQNMSIRDQLSNGIRYFDLRMEKTGKGLQMVHGNLGIYCKFNGDYLTLETVKEWIFDFLDRNPTETVILQPKGDKGGKKTYQAIYDYFKDIAVNQPDRIYIGDHVPTLGECRGKIVILSRIDKYDGDKKLDYNIDGKQWALDVLGWKTRRDEKTLYDPLGLVASGDNYEVWDQDEYGKVGDDKWTLIYNSVFNTDTGAEAKRNSVRKSGKAAWVVSYTSCTKITEIWHYPQKNARDLNPRLKDMLMYDANVLDGQFLGVVCSDFTDAQLAYLVYKQNFIGNALTVKYSVASGAGQSWNRETGGTCNFTIRRSIEDTYLSELISSVMVDGIETNAYTADPNKEKSQFIYLHIDADYMDTLSAGEHILTVKFADGRVDCSFTREADPIVLNLFVGGIQVTESNCSDVFGDGTVSYDVESGTLLLNNAVIETGLRGDGNEQNTEYGIRYNIANNLTINLVGENKIINKQTGENVTQECGIRIYQAPAFTVTGEGSLEIDMPADNENINYTGINSRQQTDLDGANITINMPGAACAVGYVISYANMLTLKNETSLKITAGNAEGSYAMTNNRYAENLRVEKGSILEAESGYRAFNAQNQITEDTRLLGAIVSDENGTSYWDGSTPLSSFQYIRIPVSDYAPTITGHNLLLSSEIGVMFKVTLPDGVEADSSSYMGFVYSDGRSEATQLIKDADKVDGENTYWFKCFINPLELADTVTATFNYGAGQTIVNQYSAMEYINYVKENDPDNTKLINLVNALQNYGHYLQKSGWKDNNTHTGIDPVEILDNARMEAARTGVSKMAAVNEPGDSGITGTSISLTLNSDTRVNVFAKLNENVSIVSPEPDETITEDSEVRYRFTSERIGARNLDKVYTFTIQTSAGTAEIKASAMSYVYAVLNGYSFTDEKKYAMTAYYEYYVAAENY